MAGSCKGAQERLVGKEGEQDSIYHTRQRQAADLSSFPSGHDRKYLDFNVFLLVGMMENLLRFISLLLGSYLCQCVAISFPVIINYSRFWTLIFLGAQFWLLAFWNPSRPSHGRTGEKGKASYCWMSWLNTGLRGRGSGCTALHRQGY